uniref:Uncharacterized protein n=2 Tax=Polytomella parva TaxID=51329 RepID=A0A7S0V0D8_9CHLO|mmetsp:Transcript_24612/g.44257  ORF Transcript_24612/g.44257 Transcript_24612/m.44257 type:complete len:486 (+) Transcript_24612:289-1746(+)
MQEKKEGKQEEKSGSGEGVNIIKKSGIPSNVKNQNSILQQQFLPSQFADSFLSGSKSPTTFHNDRSVQQHCMTNTLASQAAVSEFVPPLLETPKVLPGLGVTCTALFSDTHAVVERLSKVVSYRTKRSSTGNDDDSNSRRSQERSHCDDYEASFMSCSLTPTSISTSTTNNKTNISMTTTHSNVPNSTPMIAEGFVPLRVSIGNQQLMAKEGVVISAAVEAVVCPQQRKGRTCVFVAVEGVLAAVIAIEDPLKPEAAAVVAALRKRRIRCVMLTGDNTETAMAVGAQLGLLTNEEQDEGFLNDDSNSNSSSSSSLIPSSSSSSSSSTMPAKKANEIMGGKNVFAEQLPKSKTERILELQAHGHTVSMIGDGINDSPALAAADVGMAIGSGTDVAIEAAGFLLMRSDLRDVVTALDLSRKTMNRIRINYGWAMGYNILMVPIAAGVLYPKYRLALPPWIAGLCMAFSSVSVLASSLLLYRYRSPKV